MKLPNGDLAIVELEKLVDYCLSPDHPRGKHKARVFQTTCGLTAENADWMREQLLQVAVKGEAVLGTQTAFGQRYVIQCKLEGPVGIADVVSAWIVRDGEDFPRFVSAYVK